MVYVNTSFVYENTRFFCRSAHTVFGWVVWFYQLFVVALWGVEGCLFLFAFLLLSTGDFTRSGSFGCGFCKRVHASFCCGDHTGRRAISKLFCVCPGSGICSTANGSLGTATGKDFCALCAHLKVSIRNPGLKETGASTGMRVSFHKSKAAFSAMHLHRTCLGLS